MVSRKKDRKIERKKERNLAVLITSIHIEVSELVLKPQIPENYNGHKKERKKETWLCSLLQFILKSLNLC